MNINDRYLEFIRDKTLKSNRRPGVHVSDIVSDCLRRPWYRMAGIDTEIDDDTVAAFYYGTTIHDSFEGMFDVMEYKMHVNPFTEESNLNPNFIPEGKELFKWVSGSLDAIADDTIVDFKTCTKIPSSPSSQYKKQINFYSYMYYIHTGIDIQKGAILYLEKTSGFKKTKLFEFELLDKEVIRDLMRYSLDVISGELPPDRNESYACKWCPFLKECNPKGYT